jgi:hypothetical protein
MPVRQSLPLAICALSAFAVGTANAAVQDFDTVSQFSQLTPNAGTWQGTGTIISDQIVGITNPDGSTPVSNVLSLTGGVFVNGPSNSLYGGAWATAVSGLRPGSYDVTIRYRDRSARGFTNSLLVKRATGSGVSDESTVQVIGLPGMVTGYREATFTMTMDGTYSSIQVAGWGQQLGVTIDKVTAYRSEPTVSEDFDGFSSFAQLTPNAGTATGSASIVSEEMYFFTPRHYTNHVVITGGVRGAQPFVFGGAWFTALTDLKPGTYAVMVRYYDQFSGRYEGNGVTLKRTTSAGLADEANAVNFGLGFPGIYQRTATVIIDAQHPNIQLGGWGPSVNVHIDYIQANLVTAGNG